MLRTPQQPQTLWRTPKGYAATHCMQCKAGWTRTDAAGAVITVCLLDREPVRFYGVFRPLAARAAVRNYDNLVQLISWRDRR